MRVVLDGITVTKGEWRCAAEGVFRPGIHLVTGRVGSGKTTIAEVLAGVAPPASGRVVREGISSCMLCQQFPEYHVTEPTLAKEARSYGIGVDEALSIAGLSRRGGEDPLSLSRGELRRFQLACLSLRDWDLLILDEPFSALDCQEKHRECRRISALSSRIVVVFTHEQRYFPRTDFLWEIRNGVLHHLGAVPAAIPEWQTAPPFVRKLLSEGVVPWNLTEEDLREASCRIHG